ncbi:MAG TPA: LCP family protein [Streptosporangiaceae bacterium]|jgi:LCP family protein required for cell wall assembly
MADSGDGMERYFRARDAGDTADTSDPAPAPSAPHRRGGPSPAQARLMARIAAGRKARQRRAFLVGSAIVSTLVLFVAGAGWALTGYVNRAVARVNAGTTSAAPGAPLNILVAGVDRRNGLTSHQEAALHVGRVEGTANSDTLMLVHISPAHSRVTVISLPRDSWVNVPGFGMNKINAAYGLGGPQLMVKTVEQATGLVINDYVEVNFLAFVTVIDALGGVNVCLPEALDDSSSGVHLAAGFHHLDGIQALEYARDRHSFPLEDLTRIQDQQSLISTALSKIISSGTLENPLRVAQLLNAVLPALRVDKGLNVAGLADEMRGISPHDVVFVTVPIGNLDYQAPNGEDAITWNTSQANQLFDEISNDQPVLKPPAPKAKAKTTAKGHAKQKAKPKPAGWQPAGARTAAQAACS